MGNVAYLLKNQSNKEIIDLNLKVHVGVDPQSCENVEELKQFCQTHPNAIVIVEENSQEKTLLDDYLNKKEDNIAQIISIGDVRSRVTSDFEIEDIQHWRELVLFMKKMIPQKADQALDGQFVSIDLFYFNKILYSPFIVYSQVIDARGGLSFFPVFEAFEDISLERLNALKEKGITHLWLAKKHKVEFLSYISKELIKNISSTSADLPALNVGSSYDLVHGLFKNMGLTPETYQACQSAVAQMEQTLLKNNELKNYLAMLKSSGDLKFSYKLAQTTFVMSIAGLEYLPLMAKTAEIEKKLSYACFLKDLTLTKDSWIHLRREEQLLNTPGLNLNNRMSIQCHAREAARIVTLMPDVPRESVRIILEHHGSKNGEGFKDKISDDLHPLSAYLYLIEELSYQVLIAEGNSSQTISHILNDLTKNFPYQWSKKILEGFRKGL